MKLTKKELWRAAGTSAKTIRRAILLITMSVLASVAGRAVKAESVSTTTVQGTMYLANGQPGSGTLRVSWPGFSTAGGQLVVADSTTVTVGPDGFVSVNLAPNAGATPAGLYYTAVFYMSDGTVNTQYWLVPAAAQASLAQVQAQVMPAAQAVQAVSKAYVDQSIAQLGQSELTASGGTLTGPLFLSGDPTQPMQAANKHYVDSAVSSINTGSGTVGAGNSGQIAYYTANGTAIGGMNAVPVSAGGTGAISGLNALQNLGGISSTATSPQTIAGPLSANVNGVNVVTVFGAKGDCTGSGSTASCTDNYAAIQAAIDAAYASGGSVYFSTNPSASGQTVYYTSQPINPEGVSLYGPVGASGPPDSLTNTMPVAVRGAPGKDVFDVPDPTTPGWVAPHPSFTVSDLAILVDDSVNASASFPHRKPGRPCSDVSANGTTTITSATQCEFQPGDVGQAITVNGTTTTITGVSTPNSDRQSGFTQATLAATVSSGTNLNAYISVMNLPVTATIGNCGFAYDAKDATFTFGGGPVKSSFTRVVINTIDNQQTNSTCGYFFQGAFSPYQTRWELGYVGAMFGYVFVPADSVVTNSLNAGLGDYDVFDQTWIIAKYSFLAYDGSENSIRDMQIAAANFGPHILGAYGVEYSPANWKIDVPEIESPNSTCNVGDIAFRLYGMNQTVERLGTPFCAANSQAIQWDAMVSRGMALSPVTIGAFNLTGFQNMLNFPQMGNNFLAAALNDSGLGNQITVGASNNMGATFGGTVYPRMMHSATQQGVTDPQSSRTATVYERTHDFINKGASAYYYNDEDLWIWPDEVSNDGVGPPTKVTDSSSPTGRAIQLSGTNGYNADIVNGSYFLTGRQVPWGMVRVYVAARSTSGTVTGWGWDLWYGGTGYCSSGGDTVTTSYAVYSCDVDLSTFPLNSNLGFSFHAPGAGNTVNVAWIAVRPYDTDTLSTSLKIGTGGAAMTGNHGTGSSVQHSDGTGASGNLAAFNSDGSVTNGPAAPSGAIVGTTDAQSLTNKSIVGSEINSGVVAPAFGGTGQNESSATGVGQWSSGIYSVSNALANGTTATTQTAGDNSTKVATTAYVASPGAIAPTSVTASGLITGGNDVTRTTAATVGTTSFTTTGLVLPAVPASSTRVGRCVVYWQMSSTSYTAAFGIGMSNAPSGLWGGTSVTYAAGGTSNWLAFSQTATAATAVSTAATAGSANTTYRAEIDFTLQTGATNPVALTLYGEVSNASATLTIEPGSACYWLP